MLLKMHGRHPLVILYDLPRQSHPSVHRKTQQWPRAGRVRLGNKAAVTRTMISNLAYEASHSVLFYLQEDFVLEISR